MIWSESIFLNLAKDGFAIQFSRTAILVERGSGRGGAGFSTISCANSEATSEASVRGGVCDVRKGKEEV